MENAIPWMSPKRLHGPLMYDVFLSHAAADSDRADAVRRDLIDAGLTVYCDRIDDRFLDRSHVTRETASRLRERMRRCNVLVYVVTETAHRSVWMPWELGYFDGIRGKVIVYPTSGEALANARTQEYLSLFPSIEPGTLVDHLKRDRVEQVAPLGMLHEQEMFPAPMQQATMDTREHIQDALAWPMDLRRVTSLNLEVWSAWLRLWGVSGA